MNYEPSSKPKLDITDLITTNREPDNPIALLNHGEFGRAYDACRKLSLKLQMFAENHPDLFYGQLLVPLLKHSYDVCVNFFNLKNPENCVLVPNSTMGMKAVMEKLLLKRASTMPAGKTIQQLSNQDVINVGYLSPIYGATKNLLRSYATGFSSRLEITESILENGLFQEDLDFILKAIDEATAKSGSVFSILVCDEVASQTGRILPVKEIAEYCEQRSIILVVDGTQSFDFAVSKIGKVDYWVMSTHKWMANVKTCGIVLWSDKVDCPEPPAVSFRYFDDKAQD